MTKKEPTASTHRPPKDKGRSKIPNESQKDWKLHPEILFEDPHLIILCKPAGLLSQGEISGDQNLVDWLRHYLGRHYVGLVHRLDRNTSGIMIVAKRSKAAQRLSEQLQKGILKRTYLGWVIGTLKEPVQWRHFLKKDERTNLVRVTVNSQGGDTQGKVALLNAKPLRHAVQNGQHLTLVEFALETGRSHQIRVQAAYEGYPLAGDRKYGRQKNQQNTGWDRPALHSFKLEFDHPISGERLRFEKVSDDFLIGSAL